MFVIELPNKEDLGCHAHVAQQRGHARWERTFVGPTKTDGGQKVLLQLAVESTLSSGA